PTCGTGGRTPRSPDQRAQASRTAEDGPGRLARRDYGLNKAEGSTAVTSFDWLLTLPSTRLTASTAGEQGAVSGGSCAPLHVILMPWPAGIGTSYAALMAA